MHPTLKKLDDIFFISKILTTRKMAAMLALGFSAGLPIMLVFSTLSFWLRSEGVSRSAIGFFVWVGFAYSLKFLWAPLTDRFRIPVLSGLIGNRLAWTAVAICGTAISMICMGFQDPAENLYGVAYCAIGIAFFSATLDICVDAWRIDVSQDEEQAMMAATYQLGYRFGMILAVSGVLMVVEASSWNVAYWCVAAVAFLGAVTPFWATRPPEPSARDKAPTNWGLLLGAMALISVLVLQLQKGAALRGWLAELGGSLAALSPAIKVLLPLSFGLSILLIPFIAAAYLMTFGRKALNANALFDVPILGDFADIVRRFGWVSVLILLIVITYRVSDYTMGVMAMPLYNDLGYSEGTVGIVKGVYGITMLTFGAFVMAWSSLRFGLPKTLIAGAVLTIITNLAFSWLAQVETPRAIYLFVTIGADNLAAGFAGTALIAFMSTLTDRNFTATQYALFSSLVAFSGKFLAGFSGVLADAIGYQDFFLYTALLGLPGLIFVIIAVKIDFVPEGKIEKRDEMRDQS
jgi:PAT family beta-lactamase induction signal transducer AmpG